MSQVIGHVDVIAGHSAETIAAPTREVVTSHDWLTEHMDPTRRIW